MDVERLFEMMDSSEEPEFFRFAEMDKAYEKFYKEYISLIKDAEKENDAYEMLVEMLQMERRSAFLVGYKTAVKLILTY
ncbi:MAG: hypothetical protein VB120_05285 [Lachnospiraceae bacterium]|nr:hypothetical protein [Lachnospiraceae bacterium]